MPKTSAPPQPKGRFASFVSSYEGRLALATGLAIALHLILALALPSTAPWWIYQAPLIAIVFIGGAPLVREVLAAVILREAVVDLLDAGAVIPSVAVAKLLGGGVIVLILIGL